MPTLPDRLRLANDRVILRDWRDEDAPALAPVCGEWNVCAFTSVPWEWSEAEALAWIDRQRHKRAAATALLIDWGLRNLGIERVEFAILPENVGSQRVAERVGAIPLGIREKSHLAEGRWWDMTIWSVGR